MRLTTPAALMLAVVVAGCKDATSSDHTSPPPRSRVFAIGDTVIDTLSVTRLWLFNAVAGEEVNVFLGALSKDPFDRDRGLALWLTDSAGTQRQPTYLVTATGNDTILEGHSGGRIILPSTARYGLQIAWCCNAVAYTGPFDFWVYRINRAPESVDSMLPLGDSITGESLDHVGDVDTYHYTAAPGQWFNLFLLADEGFTTDMFAQIPALDVAVYSNGFDSALTQRASGRFVDSTGGARLLQVYGESDRDYYDRGRYKLLLYPINWAPETVPPDLAPGDSVLTESIDLPGDVDEFIVHVPGGDSILVNSILTQLSSAGGMGIDMRLTRPGDSRLPGTSPPPGEYGLGDTWLQPGQDYALRLYAYSGIGGYAGPYALRFYRIDLAPETLPALVAIGDTVEGEALDPVGDVDTFEFDAASGDQLSVALQGTSAVDTGSFVLVVSAPGGSDSLGSAYSPSGGVDLGAYRTGRFTIPATGRWQVAVTSGGFGVSTAGRGPYRFAVLRLPTAPESAPASFAIGDSVTTEVLDAPDDVDEFTLTGAPGQPTILLFQYPTNAGFLELVDPVTRLAFDTLESDGFEQSSGLVTLPASGQLLLRVYTLPDSTGAYRIVASPNTPAPETIAAQVAIGDTVAGEALTPDGDIDEFQFPATAGHDLRVDFQTPTGVNAGVILDAVDPATNTVLGTVTSYGTTTNLEDQGTAPFTIPQDGTYMIRVRGAYPTYGSTFGSGGFRFRIVALN